MPLAPQRMNKMHRTEKAFIVSLVCFILSWTLCTLKNTTEEVPYSLDSYIEQSGRLPTLEVLEGNYVHSPANLNPIAQNWSPGKANSNQVTVTDKLSSTRMVRQHHETAKITAETNQALSDIRLPRLRGDERNESYSVVISDSTVDVIVSETNNMSTQVTAVVSSKKKVESPRHNPEYFMKEVPLESLIRRGNLLTAHTGCSIATWSYNGKRHASKPLNECRQQAKSAEVFQRHQLKPETASRIKPFDSVYVPIVKLEHFVNETLPLIENDFILMTGQYSMLEGLEITRRVYNALLEHPRVVRWFLQNLSVYAYDPHHPKVRVRRAYEYQHKVLVSYYVLTACLVTKAEPLSIRYKPTTKGSHARRNRKEFQCSQAEFYLCSKSAKEAKPGRDRCVLREHTSQPVHHLTLFGPARDPPSL